MEGRDGAKYSQVELQKDFVTDGDCERGLQRYLMINFSDCLILFRGFPPVKQLNFIAWEFMKINYPVNQIPLQHKTLNQWFVPIIFTFVMLQIVFSEFYLNAATVCQIPAAVVFIYCYGKNMMATLWLRRYKIPMRARNGQPKQMRLK